MSLEAAAGWILAAGLFPLWLASGFADWFCHRRTRIETTSGLGENVFHLILASLMGLGAMMLMFLEINLAMLVVLALLFIAHEVVTQLDLRWAIHLREINAAEQQIHTALEAVPFAALVAVALIVMTGKTAFAIELKHDPIDWRVGTGMIAAMLLFGAAPYWEEFARCWRNLGELARDPARALAS